MVTVPQKMVRLERMSDYRGVRLERYHRRLSFILHCSLNGGLSKAVIVECPRCTRITVTHQKPLEPYQVNMSNLCSALLVVWLTLKELKMAIILV